MDPRALYLYTQILRHAHVFFSERANAAVRETDVRFVPLETALRLRHPCIAIPTDLIRRYDYSDAYEVTVAGATLRLCHRILRPDSREWTAFPTESAPLWLIHESGTRLPAWDLFGTLFSLLTLEYEGAHTERDRHGRFIAAFDPRLKAGLLEQPLFNDAVFLLIVEAFRMREGDGALSSIADEIKPPAMILSHDCDILEGNDIWTQSIRLGRVVLPLAKRKTPRLDNLWWAVRNAVKPREFYFDNIPGLITLERTFGYRSTFYILNGTGGRFGARSGSKLLASLVGAISDTWEIGIHYNYDTHLDHDRFSRQQAELHAIAGRTVSTGRAHYLRFDPVKSLPFYRAHGITLDESVGYPDRIGYRVAVGGCYRPYDPESEREMDMWQVPMVVMENTLLAQYADNSLRAFTDLLNHLSRVGGALSLIFHPGLFYNPEFRTHRRLYHRMLQTGRDHGAFGWTARHLSELASSAPTVPSDTGKGGRP
ncbi:MAG: hypothetical protein RBT76_00395 [candidate division Zixibacteria bacterium]|jgi:hypothetical protein|nr:hypothetical protein [candidate division Zixibacteria bacterium]